jgi:hypothetical protein
LTHDITLPLNQKIIFPAICVVCEKENPDSKVELSFLESKFSAFEATTSLLTASTYHVENPSHSVKGVPACKECAQRLKSHHRWLKIISYASWSLGIVLAIFLPIEIWIKIIIFALFLILPGFVSVIFPTAFNLTISKDMMTFEFTSKKIADKFRKLNQT